MERQDNVKTVFADGSRTPLARELGETWYVRQPKAACAEAEAWATPRLAFWTILMEEWEAVLAEGRAVREVPLLDGAPRYALIGAIEEKYFARVAKDPAVAEAARKEVRAAIARPVR